MSEQNTQEAQKGGSQEPQFDLNTVTPEQFIDRLKTDKDLATEYMNDPYAEKFARISSIIDGKKPPEVNQIQQPSQEQQSVTSVKSQQQVPESVTINGKVIPKDLFGSYLTEGRSVEDAVIEALKGNKEKDATIVERTTRNDQLINDTLNLRRQLMVALGQRDTAQQESQHAKTAAAAAQPQQFEVEQVDFDVLNDIDPYDLDKSPSKIEKAKAELAKLKASFEKQKAGKQAAQPTATAATPDQGTQQTQQQQAAPSAEAVKTRKELEQSVVDLEYADIEALQRAAPELRTRIPFAQLDVAVGNFQTSAAQMNGTPGNPAAAMQLYFSDTPQGEGFRSLCKTRGVEAPEGYDVHQFIIGNVRSQRLRNMNNYRQLVELKSGKKLDPWELLEAPGISYVENYRNVVPFKSRQEQKAPEIPQNPDKLQQQIQQHAASAQIPPTKTVPEIPPSMGGGAPQVDFGATTQGEMVDLIDQMQRGTISKESARRLAGIYENVHKIGGPPVPQALIDKLKE
jgi:hypothetical protein